MALLVVLGLLVMDGVLVDLDVGADVVEGVGVVNWTVDAGAEVYLRGTSQLRGVASQEKELSVSRAWVWTGSRRVRLAVGAYTVVLWLHCGVRIGVIGAGERRPPKVVPPRVGQRHRDHDRALGCNGARIRLERVGWVEVGVERGRRDLGRR